jgi:GntR family transcriptional regulator, transcriptional repressor for pyruvate dehydrogenase complex
MGLVDAIGERIRDGRLAPGDKLPTESAVMAEFGVSRTVVREAISKLQAAGRINTRHGVGSFVAAAGEAADGAGFRIGPEHCATLHDVVAVLELRIGVETEAAGLAALRRGPEHLAALREALAVMAAALAAGSDAAAADYQFHLGIARATQNPHFADLMATLGAQVIPRARLAGSGVQAAEPLDYLRRVQVEHETIFDAIAAQDAEAARAAMRTHLSNSRERRRKAAARLTG